MLLNYLCVWSNGLFEFLQIVHVDQLHVQAKATQHLRKESIGSAINVVTRQNMIAGAQHLQNGRRGAQSRGKRKTVLGSVQLGQTGLENVSRGVSTAPIFELLRGQNIYQINLYAQVYFVLI